jgi:competence protein ComEC
MFDISKLKRGKVVIPILFLFFAIILMSSCSAQTNTGTTNNNETQATSSDNSVRPNNNEQKDSNTSSVNGQIKIHYIDVGQGDSILIQQGNSNMLIDTGTNASASSLVAYLKGQNISKLDYLVLTHPHEDHVGGADAVINTFDIGKIYMPKVTSNTKTFKNVVNAMNSKGLKATAPNPGDTFKLGDAVCTILGPININTKDLNTYSIVIRLVYGNNKFLFTGDAQSSNEEDMINKGFELSADVLKVGHHGSETSTSDAFLNAVNPKYAVISCGQGNDYGHPHKSTMEKLQAKGINVYRTDECGTIVCTSDGNNISFNVKEGDYKYGSESGSSSSSKASSTSAVSQKAASTGTSQSTQSQSVTVYVTNSGQKYHTTNCSSLSKSKIAITLEEAKKEGYTPCSKCNPPH